MIQRLDQLTGPVDVGTSYLVPTVLGTWYRKTAAWPVIGPRHNDRHCIGFANDHYHLDARFVSGDETDYHFWRAVWGSPLQISDKFNVGGLPAPFWLRRKCKRLINPVDMLPEVSLAAGAGRAPGWKCHFDEWTGKQAKHDGHGWICPHRMVPLADHAPVNGVITCPLHLLRIDATTGIVLAPESEAA
ncbi:Rieske 2Fe-2S domain-containing protein [Rhizobium sp. L51/94]|uniref:Rieske (2Fe-2S) protein n=1 Tax=Rhizobium sp. L51/94 TaxID=2819999 RepID=UPI001C5B966A|nr:Rieske 2Fe-2S domain-containing protein [Rhizobium sp. L51/94]QXZ79638.1 Rieske 2Fe-2S domain-containing protein [Rhizobium sp. L51/94]